MSENPPCWKLQRAVRALHRNMTPVNDAAASPLEDKLAIRDGLNTDLVPFADIDWIDAAGDYMCVYATGKTYVMRCTMKELQQRLRWPIRSNTSIDPSQSEQSTVTGSLAARRECAVAAQRCALKVSRNFRQEVRYSRPIVHRHSLLNNLCEPVKPRLPRGYAATC